MWRFILCMCGGAGRIFIYWKFQRSVSDLEFRVPISDPCDVADLIRAACSCRGQRVLAEGGTLNLKIPI